MTVREKILYRASGKIGVAAPSTNAERAVFNELLLEGLIEYAGFPQNSTTPRYKKKVVA